MKYWLMKSEPDVYGIEALEKDLRTRWEGVRNYQARNFMRDEMNVGDPVLFYHSNAEPPGIAGVAEVSALAAPDKTQFDKKSEYFDPKAKVDNPPWVCPEVRFVQKFARVLSLEELRAEKSLASMALMQKGQRLSVQSVSKEHYELILKMAASLDSSVVGNGTVASSTKGSSAKGSAAGGPSKKSSLKKLSADRKTPLQTSATKKTFSKTNLASKRKPALQGNPA